MGKGSYEGIEIDWELLRKEMREQERIDKLKSLGYEFCKINYKWYYRRANSNRKWTPLD